MHTRRGIIWKLGPILFGIPLGLVLFLMDWFRWYGTQPSRMLSLEFWVLLLVSPAAGYGAGALFGSAFCAVMRWPST
jgi:hypothetical protein